MEDLKTLYADSDLALMKLAEASLEKGADRLIEVRNFALNSGFKKIGIAYCAAVAKEAEIVDHFLSKDFEVVRIDCKTGKFPKSEMLDDGSLVGISCNPMGQAAYLAECGAQMNIVMGLCVGHDMVFGMNSHVPTTTLLVKDRAHKHNPLEGINSKKAL